MGLPQSLPQVAKYRRQHPEAQGRHSHALQSIDADFDRVAGLTRYSPA
jgi:hypothetical protein